MAKMIGINIGFITNSSSCVYHFPRELLDDPNVQAFMSAMEIEDGFVGDDLWHRGGCASVLVTKEQRDSARSELQSSDYSSGPAIEDSDKSVVVIYGDEYPGLATTLSHLLQQAGEAAGLGRISYDDYN